MVVKEVDKYAEFKAAFKRFIQEICLKLNVLGIPSRKWTRVIPTKEGISLPQEIRPDLTGIIMILMLMLEKEPWDSLKNLTDTIKNTRELASILLVDLTGKPINGTKMEHYWIVTKLTSEFLKKYLERTGSIKFDEQYFNTVFDILKSDLESPSITVKQQSPLINTSLDCESISLEPNISIRKISTNELEDWFNNYVDDPYLGSSMSNIITTNVTGLDCAIEIIYQKKRIEDWGPSIEARKCESDIVTALRLHSNKNICVAFTTQTDSGFIKSGAGVSSSIRPRLHGEKAKISAANQQEIIDIWNQIRTLPSESPMRLALRRWNAVFERFDPDDALIDYWIALEALFVADLFLELRHRSSFRIAGYLGEAPDQREQIYKDLLESYDLRSRIVHGGVPANKRKTELINITRSYLRKALVKILSSVDTFDAKEIEIEQLRK